MTNQLSFASYCGSKDQEVDTTHQVISPTPLSNLTETTHHSSNLDEHNRQQQQSEKEEPTPATTTTDEISHIENEEEPASVVKMSVDKYYSPLPAVEVVSGRERLKRHRNEVAGRVWIPDLWGHEKLLKEWTDCSAFDSALFPNGLMSARAALVREGRRANMENRCS
ncbi:hypothetical protein C5167_002834 [Papaver somniferum]|uniref:Uncharacterized protein n=1 Tax=Papaver somniferum TaxID=3469 RepID=A0A4Y7L0D7_PAPSO|nr:protein BIC1-like [Papaver somniferum]RZC78626.1 hypothetical protein C5167_002834 [Papaver somniferum]